MIKLREITQRNLNFLYIEQVHNVGIAWNICTLPEESQGMKNVPVRWLVHTLHFGIHISIIIKQISEWRDNGVSAELKS
jgi:hypothetical protein